jgi:hypothetical protein
MDLPPIYSRRNRQVEPSESDVYSYNAIPANVRVQVVQILESGLGVPALSVYGNHQVNPCYGYIVKQCAEKKAFTDWLTSG